MPNVEIKIIITVEGKDQIQANAKSFETAGQELGNLERYIQKNYAQTENE